MSVAEITPLLRDLGKGTDYQVSDFDSLIRRGLQQQNLLKPR